LLREGTVRVQQVSENGREIVLYRVFAGESCALTTACLIGYEEYQAEGIAETDVEAVAIPRSTFDELSFQKIRLHCVQRTNRSPPTV
jgi:CRP/FNR family transcriptional regulator